MQNAESQRGWRLWFEVCFSLGFVMGLLALVYTFWRARPLGANDNGVITFLFKRTWKQIKWTNINSIEKRRIYNSVFYVYRFEFVIFSERTQIRFDDWIGDLSDLIAVLNFYIKRHNIPAFSVDRGRDTLQKISRLETDRTRRRKLLNEGVRVPVAEL
jgi:hypothetical protein